MESLGHIRLPFNVFACLLSHQILTSLNCLSILCPPPSPSPHPTSVPLPPKLPLFTHCAVNTSWCTVFPASTSPKAVPDKQCTWFMASSGSMHGKHLALSLSLSLSVTETAAGPGFGYALSCRNKMRSNHFFPGRL